MQYLCSFYLKFANEALATCICKIKHKILLTAWRTSDEKIKYIASTIQKTTSIKMNCKLY